MASRIPPKAPPGAADAVLHQLPGAVGAAVVAKSKLNDAVAMQHALAQASLRAPAPGLLGRAGRAWGAFAQHNARLFDAGARIGGALSVLTGASTAVSSGSKTVHALGQALFSARHGYASEARQHLVQALDDGLDAGRGLVTAGRGAITFHNVSVGRAGATAAVEAFRSKGGFRALSERAAREVEALVADAGSTIAVARSHGTAGLAGRSMGAAVEAGKRSVGEAVLHANALRPAGELAGKLAARAELRGAEAALRAGARAGATTLGKAAARFAPGLNIAMAVIDTGIAGRDLYLAVKSPTPRSIGKAVMAGLTAAGSIVAATNIPVVSQIGAAASTVTGFLSALF